jgi:hypothetical protein
MSNKCDGRNGCAAIGQEILASTQSAGPNACNGQADYTRTGLVYQNPNFGFQSWQDVLALLYGGKDDSTGTVDCGSAKRQALVDQWGNLFQDSCANPVSTCTTASLMSSVGAITIGGRLWHAFRPDDGSSVAEIFAQLIGIGTVPGPAGTLNVPSSATALNGFGTSPYCNALNWDTTPCTAPAQCNEQSQGDGRIAHCHLGANHQFVGPGGVLDSVANDGIHRRPPPGAWGNTSDPNYPVGVDVQPTSYQDNDPVRRPCIGGRTFVGNPNHPAEEVCNLNGTLGVVLPIPSVDFIPQQNNGRNPFPTSLCVTYTSALEMPVFTCAPRGITHGACPDGTVPTFGCYLPVDASGSSLCENQPDQWPTADYPAQDGRIFNMFVFSETNGYTLRTFAGGPNGTLQLPFGGAFARIHQTLPLWDQSNPSTKGTSCQQQDGTVQVGCLVQADPCSLGLGDSTANNASNTSLRVDQFTP